MGQEELERPLVLLVATRRAEGEHRLAVAQRERGTQRRPRALAALEAVRMRRVEGEPLRARAQAEAEAGDDRRALQPSAAWRAGDEIAVPVRHRDVARVARVSRGARAF